MKQLVLVAAGAAVMTFAAGAAMAETWGAAYGGTIVATYDDGHQVKVFVQPDHSFRIVPATGAALTGTWSDEAGQSCFTITQPKAATGGAPTCVADKDYQVGDSFDGKDATGPFHAVINPGR
jgi:hypothetical protein